ncbi:hypothetical protein GE09DRAFT_1209690 [Coniochaeta sp. 2T2.1]|nr:hypothetical protein GE09DRAFT_1209690 [Coniochaeta sp. 2T2.1]
MSLTRMPRLDKTTFAADRNATRIITHFLSKELALRDLRFLLAIVTFPHPIVEGEDAHGTSTELLFSTVGPIPEDIAERVLSSPDDDIIIAIAALYRRLKPFLGDSPDSFHRWAVGRETSCGVERIRPQVTAQIWPAVSPATQVLVYDLGFIEHMQLDIFLTGFEWLVEDRQQLEDMIRNDDPTVSFAFARWKKDQEKNEENLAQHSSEHGAGPPPW